MSYMKQILGNLKNKVFLFFMHNIWSADLAVKQLLKTHGQISNQPFFLKNIIVHVIKHAHFRLYRACSDKVIWEN